MKRFLATILSLIVLVGCVQSDTDNPIVRIETDEPFYGSFEDVNATRTYVNEAMTMLWHADDRISLFRSTLNEEFKFAGETGDSAGSFEEIPSDIFVTGAEISTNYGVYPYNSATTIGDDETITLTMPSVQTYAQNSFGCGANTAVAATESSSSRFLPFRNVGGFLVVKIYSPSGVVKSVELKGNNGEVLAGEATVQAKYGYLPLLTMGDGTDSITLDCGGGVEVGTTEDSATHFWFVVPPTTFESGFTVSVTDTAGAVTTKSTTKRNEILRNEVTVMSAFEIAETENKPTPANNEIWYTAPAKLEPYDNSVFGATYLSNIWDSETGKGVITFEGDVTKIGDYAFYNRTSLTSVTIGDSVTTIGNGAFWGCDSLTSVTIPDSVTTIGEFAFYNCDSLTSVTIPDSVTTIGKEAFDQCDSLTSVTIGNGVKTIGEMAFADCTSLKEFKGKFAADNGRCLIMDNTIIAYANASGTTYTIPDSVTTIGDEAFYNCDSLISVTIPDSVTTIGDEAFDQCDSLTSVTIGDSVTTIGNYAFSFCSSLASVTIPDSVTTIGERAFSDCDSLTNVTIGNSVTTIGEKAFNDCCSLTSVTIPNSVTTIGDSAFYECSSLTSVTIGDSVTTIGYQVFSDCYSLKTVYCKPTTPPTGGSSMFDYNASGRKIYVPAGYVESYRISNYWIDYADHIIGYNFENGEVDDEEEDPSHPANPANNEIWYTATAKVEPHDKTVFDATYVSNEWNSETGRGVITFEGDVTMIGDYAFYQCSSLTSVTIGDSVTTIGKMAFYQCYRLTSVTIPDSVTTIGDWAFDSCTSLTSVTIPDSVTTIGDWAFDSCTSLTSVTIGNSVTTIGGGTFAHCTSLKEFKGKFAADNGRCLIMDNTIIAYAEASGTTYTIPDSVTTIGDEAFYYCESLTSVTIPDSVTEIGEWVFEQCDSLTSVTIPDSVTTIGEGAFSYCTCLTSVTIPDSVTSIGNYAFRNCESLTSVIIPDSVTTIGKRAFEYCDSLTSITIPDSVTEIREWAFEHCYSLTSVTIPDSVTTIGEGAFSGCDSLTSVTIGDSVTTIGKGAFSFCDSLTSVTIGNSVTTIGGSAFYECRSLTSVTIPDSVTTIGYQAFSDCYSLKTVHCKPTTPPTGGSSMFDYNAEGRRIFVPASDDDSIIKAYKAAKYWSDYADYIFE